MASLGSRLRSARDKSGLTQMEVAEKLGISNGAISGYERNYRDPDTDTLKRLAELYGVSIDWLKGHGNKKESAGTLPKSKLDEAVRRVNETLDIDITDDPDIMAALETYLLALGKIKKQSE